MPAKLKWAGDGPRVPTTIHWPSTHRERYQQEAAKRGLSLNEYVIRALAEMHGIATSPSSTEEGEQLPLGA